jgi:hypothetical protein
VLVVLPPHAAAIIAETTSAIAAGQVQGDRDPGCIGTVVLLTSSIVALPWNRKRQP